MKVVSALLGVALVVVGGAAIHLRREVEAGREQIASLRSQLQQRDAQRAVMPVLPPAAASVPQNAASVAAPGPAAAARAEKQDADAAIDAIESITATARRQMASPEGQARYRQTARMLMETSNPGIDEALGLTAEETDRLLDLLAKQQLESSSLFTLDPDRQVSMQQRSADVRQLQAGHDVQLQAMLGSKYSLYQDYKQVAPVWRQRQDLAAVLEAAGTPMTEAQGRSLVAALSVEHRNFTQQARAATAQGGTPADLLARNSPDRRQRQLDIASAYLSPGQLESYRGMLERAAEQERAMLAPLQRLQAPAGATSVPAP